MAERTIPLRMSDFDHAEKCCCEKASLAAEIERLRAALEVFACDCGPGGEEPCPKPENCRNHIARAALEEGRT